MVAVFIGAGLGVPPGTPAANPIGGYIIGLAIAFFASFSRLAPEWWLLSSRAAAAV